MTSFPRRARLVALFVPAAFAAGAPARSAVPACSTPPLFDLSGPACTSPEQSVACGCSECVLWDPAEGATWYEIRRCNVLDGSCLVIGDTRGRNRPGATARMWCAAWDYPFPAAGVPYDYAVRACKDGATGPICSTALSNAVRYVAAPYMCFSGGLEVPCLAASWPLDSVTDLDADGVPDASDDDDDGDARLDVVDNCPRDVNLGQRDVDGDGIGDVCDREPHVKNAGGAADADGDGVPDLLDRCAAVWDPFQADADADRIGDACDNCVAKFNDGQSDGDGDGEGDRCDLNDGLLSAVWETRTRIAWEPETGFTTYSVYRGGLAELRAGAGYTQAIGSNPLAARWCGVAGTGIDDATAPAPGATAFYLAAGRIGAVEGSLGTTGDGAERTNTRPCP